MEVTMKYERYGALGVVLGLLLLALPVSAHHAVTAEFDLSKTFTISGTISKLEWINPHVFIYVDVKDDSGNVVTYAFGNASPGFLRRGGVLGTMFHKGDQVTVDAYAPKDGTPHRGFINAVHFADGHTIVLSKDGRSD
jgi:Family of unknown function (DUF6152)